jgi:hypothetical protein
MKNAFISKSNKFALGLGFWGPIVPQNGGFCGLLQLFQNLLNFAFTISIPIATLVIAYGGFRIMTAAGSPTGLKAGRDAITAALIGVVIVFGAWIIINTLLNVVGANSSVAPWNQISC